MKGGIDMKWSITYLVIVMVLWFIMITIIVIGANNPMFLDNPAMYGFISHLMGAVCTALFVHALSEIKYEFDKTTKGD